MAVYRVCLPARSELLGLVTGLRGRAPACRCAPEPCHADVPSELAERLS